MGVLDKKRTQKKKDNETGLKELKRYPLRDASLPFTFCILLTFDLFRRDFQRWLLPIPLRNDAAAFFH